MTSEGGPLFGDTSQLTSTRRRFIRSTSWSFVAEAGGQLTTLVVSFVLAALVGPAGYGIVAMATVYVLLVELVQRQGIASAIIQRREMTAEHASAAFWLVLATSVIMTAVSVALAGWWAGVNDVPQLQPVILALSALLPLKALTVVQEALLRRRMDFKKVALRTTVGAVIGGAVGVAVAVVDPSVWAFVAQQLTAAGMSVVLLWAVTPWRPRLSFSITSARDLLGFSTGSFLSSLGTFVNNRADALLVGLFFGPVAVGVYRFASRIMESFLGFVVRPLNSLALPELSPFQERPDVFRERLQRLSRLAGVVGLPALGVLLAAVEPMVRILGSAWSATALPLQLLCIVAAIRVLTTMNGPMLQALGRPHLQAALTWFTAVASATSFVVAAILLRNSPITEQVWGLAVSRVAFYGSVILGVHLVLVRRIVRSTVRSHLAVFIPSGLAGAAAALGGMAIGATGPVSDLSVPIHLVVVVGVSACAAAIGFGAVDGVFRARMWALLRNPARPKNEDKSTPAPERAASQRTGR